MTIKFLTGDESILHVSVFEDKGGLDLYKLKYDMAIEDLDPRYGRIVAKHIVLYDGI